MTVPAKLIPRQWNIYRNVPRERLAEQIRVFVAALDLDKPFRVIVEQWKKNRTLEQNAYLNAVVYKIIGDAVGYERDDVSEFLCGEFFGWREVRAPKKPGNPTGIVMRPIRTTTRDENGNYSPLKAGGDQKPGDPPTFSDYVAFCQRFAATKGIHVPDPDPNHADHREEEAA